MCLTERRDDVATQVTYFSYLFWTSMHVAVGQACVESVRRESVTDKTCWRTAALETYVGGTALALILDRLRRTNPLIARANLSRRMFLCMYMHGLASLQRKPNVSVPWLKTRPAGTRTPRPAPIRS